MDMSRLVQTQSAVPFFGLKTKLLLPLLCIVLLTLAASGYAVMRMSSNALLKAGRQEIVNSAHVVASSVLAQINRAKTDIQFAYKTPAIAATLDPEGKLNMPNREALITFTNKLLADFGSVSGYYETLYTVDEKGMTLACSVPSVVGVLDISNRQWFHQAMRTGELTLSLPFRSRFTNDALMAVALRFSHAGHTGVMVGSLIVRQFAKVALEAESSETQRAIVVSAGGMVVASLKDDEIGTSPFAGKDWFTGMVANNLAYSETTENGVEYAVAMRPLAGTDLYALILVDKKTLVEPIKAVESITLIAILAALLLAWAGIYAIVAPTARDIRRLAEYAESIGSGEHPSVEDIRRNDEVGVLSRSLESMVADLTRMVEKAELATLAKSDFLARMSHEIRTPMNVVMGMAQIAMQNTTDERQLAYLTKIWHAAENLLGIINDILDFSKIEAGKMNLENKPFRLSGVLRSVHDLLESKAKEKKLALRFTQEDGTPDVYSGDSLRLSQVCINLCSNALKFTNKGEITLTVRVEGGQDDKTRLLFAVRDTGIGMTKQQQEGIFEAFSQADGSTTRRFGGTGLGLAICKLLVKLMGGEIWADSVYERGSTFYFTVLLERASEETTLRDYDSSAAYTPTGNLAGASVLLVEDNALNQEIATEFLAMLNITPVIASNGAEAVAMAANTRYDIVLMDIQMPIMGGLEAAERIRENEKEHGVAPVPIVAMTANAMSGDRDKSLAAGMNAHITKPIDMAELERTLLAWLPAAHTAPENRKT